ncbi:MAG: ATP-binding cassette domain-containing protein [Ruminococcus sp.]
MSQLEGIRDLKVADENAEVIIKFNDVCKTYTLYRNDQERFKALFFKPRNPILHHALDHVNLEIRKGEAVGIMGDNGSGKSTMLKTITGVTFPDHGNVEVKGMVAALLELTAGFSLEMTGRQNIYLKGYILGLDDDEIKIIEENVVDFAELGDYIDQPVRTYSSGMKMRLGFAINVNIAPDILVVDEALSVGDAAFKVKCKNKIKEVIEDSDVTVLYVSHNASSVMEICPRSIYLKKGKIMFDGPTEETHLVYLVDKRSMQIENVTARIEKLNNMIETSAGDIAVLNRKLKKNTDRLANLKADLEQFKQDLENYRKEHYKDNQ